MRKLLPLLLCCLLLAGCTRDPLEPMVTATNEASLPAPAVAGLPMRKSRATLLFRYGEEPLLAAETREISTARTESYAFSLMSALLNGPSAASTELEGLFPSGTRVISVHQSGRLMFVTLSRHIMNGFPDEPGSWRDQADWAIEVPLRRELAMQSIAATLTENCDVDQVIILVEQTDAATDSLRLRQGYYTLDGSTSLAEPLQRDERLLLSPARTAEVILQCWQESDWTRLYRYIAHHDPATGDPRPEESAFVQQMTVLPHLLRAEAQGGNVSEDGRSAVFTVNGAWLANGAEAPLSGMVLRLIREGCVWRVGLSQLIGREALQ